MFAGNMYSTHHTNCPAVPAFPAVAISRVTGTRYSPEVEYVSAFAIGTTSIKPVGFVALVLEVIKFSAVFKLLFPAKKASLSAETLELVSD